MCTPPLEPVGASPDDSQAASGPCTCDRAVRLSFPGVWSPGDSRAGAVRPIARGRGCGRACRRGGRGGQSGAAHDRFCLRRPDQRARRAVERDADVACRLLPVPRSRRDPRLHGGLGAERERARLRAQRAHGRHPARRLRDRRLDRLAHLRRRAQGPGDRLVRRHPSPISSSPARRSPCSRAASSRSRASAGAPWTSGASCAPTAPTAAPRSRCTSTSRATGTTCPPARRSCWAIPTPPPAGSREGRRPRCNAPASPAGTAAGRPRRGVRHESRPARRSRRPGPGERRDAHGFGRRASRPPASRRRRPAASR